MLWTLKYSKDLDRFIVAFPNRVSFGDVATQSATFREISVKHKGDVVGRQPILTVAYKSGQWMSAD